MPYSDPEAKKRIFKERALAETPNELHGTHSGYFNWSCRCEPCRAFAKSYHASRRELKVRKHGGRTRVDSHGTGGMYSKGCRCDECKDYKQIEHRLYTYGLTQEVYLQIMKTQAGLCAICKKSAAVHVDHCHETNKVRGILCKECNWGLGWFKDNKTNLNSAIQYLEDSH